MKGLLLFLVALLLIPGLVDGATLGLYFDEGMYHMSRDVTVESFFDIYVYLCNANYYVGGVEYSIETPQDPEHSYVEILGWTISGLLYIGTPFTGQAIAFWPPLNGFTPGCNFMATIHCVSHADCYPPGCLSDPACYSAKQGGPYIDVYHLVVGPHPDSGKLILTNWPEYNEYPVTGLTSILCQAGWIGTERTSWGAIKSLF